MEEFLERLKQTDVELSPASAAIKYLNHVLKETKATTIMSVIDELALAAGKAKEQAQEHSISVEAACGLFRKHILRSRELSDASKDFEEVKDLLIKRGEILSSRLVNSRERVASLGFKFIGDAETVLVHGFSRAVARILKVAAEKGRNFDVIVTESRPDCSGYKYLDVLKKFGIPTTLIMDTSIGFVMEKVDVVLVGAEGVLESGGVANKIGTFPLAIVAKAHQKPFYVAAESFKFSRSFPLNQRDLGAMGLSNPQPSNPKLLVKELQGQMDETTLKEIEVDSPEKGSSPVATTTSSTSSASIRIEATLTDLTPPEYITLIISDLGVLTPAAVSDELIKLFQ